MTEIRFYHLQKQSLDQALPLILQKALSTGKNIVLKLPDPAQIDAVSRSLWSYDPNSFLPHGSEKDGMAEDQPIWLTHQDDNPNGAEILFTVLGAAPGALDGFNLYCNIFNGYDQAAVQDARAQWKIFKDKGMTMTYWQQDQSGKWEQKA